MNESVQIYVNVNAAGHIQTVYSGKNIVMTEQYHYCFIGDEDIAENAHLYKVVINEMVPELVQKTKQE